MRLVRNVFRRKLRAFLTIFGITIGVFALVVMGGMAEKINLLVDGGTRFYSDKVTISDPGASAGFGAPLAIGKIADLERVPGVAKASASVIMMLEKESTGMVMGMPEMIVGTDLRGQELESFVVTFAAGRDLQPGERGTAAVGSDLVQKLGAEVGRPITLRGRTFQVVGIMDKTLTAPDKSVSVPLADAQAMFVNDLPEMVRRQVDASQLTTGMTVYTEPGVDPDKLAETIEHEVSGVKADGPKAFQEMVGNSTKLLNAIIFGVALISLLVGGLSVVNTMTMSVFERTREVGIRKAIGASNRQIVWQFLGESAFIGLMGGLGGLVLGWLVTLGLNGAGNSAGTALFLVTSRLAIGSVAFALFLGVVSGLYPSWHAARLNPVVALRYE